MADSQYFVFDVVIFLPRDAVLARCVLWACVCLSVCPSVTTRSSPMAKRRIMLIVPYTKLDTLVF